VNYQLKFLSCFFLKKKRTQVNNFNFETVAFSVHEWGRGKGEEIMWDFFFYILIFRNFVFFNGRIEDYSS